MADTWTAIANAISAPEKKRLLGKSIKGMAAELDVSCKGDSLIGLFTTPVVTAPALPCDLPLKTKWLGLRQLSF